MGAATAWIRRRRSTRGRAAPRGLAVAELLVALGVLVLLVGSTLPVALRRLENERERQTRERLEALARPVRTYALDTGAVPQMPRDLLSPPAGARGWSGPYVDAEDSPGAIADGWGRELVLLRERETLLAIVSSGADGRIGTSDDLRHLVHVAEP